MSKHVICRCEEIRLDEIQQALDAGARTVNDVKRQTRAGMGLCQGIYCVSEIARMIAHTHDQNNSPVASMTARPPVRVVTLAALAGLAGTGDSVS